ncbi:MAG: dephospho-CoA kinase [Nocardioidaceae bacterium]
MDRPVLGRLVFEDPEARAQLEAIVHPRVRARAAEIEKTAPSDAVVVHAIPLLVETGQVADFDLVVVVDAPVSVQVQRLVTDRAMSESAAFARIAAQASRDDRLAMADYVISNCASENDPGRSSRQTMGRAHVTERREELGSEVRIGQFAQLSERLPLELAHPLS